MIPYTSFFYSKIIVDILVFLPLHVNYRTYLSISIDCIDGSKIVMLATLK